MTLPPSKTEGGFFELDMDNTAKMPVADDSVFLDPNPADVYKDRARAALAEHARRVVNMSEPEREKAELKARSKERKGKPQANYNERTKEVWKDRGYSFEIVEHYNAFAGRKNDLFGFIDALAVGPDGIVGVQMTSKSHMSERMKKAQAAPAYKNWLASGARFVVMGWEKNKSGRYEFVERWGE